MDNLSFDRCPVCGETETIAKILSEESQKNGDLEEGQYVALMAIQAPFVNPNMKSKIFAPAKPVLIATVIFDVCSKCGCVFARQVASSKTALQQPPNPSGKGFNQLKRN